MLAQKYAYKGTVTCKNTSTIVSAQSAILEQRDKLQDKQIVETDWTYEPPAPGEAPAAPVVAATAPSPATTTHTATSAPAAAATAAPALALAPPPPGKQTPYHCYFDVVLPSDRKHTTMYTNGVFYSDEERPWIDFWWSEYIHSTYHITNANVAPNCAPFPADPAKQQSAMSSDETNWKLHNYNIVHVDWKPTKTPPAGESEPAGPEIAAGHRLNQPIINPPAQSPAPAAAAVHGLPPASTPPPGRVYHYYCSSEMGFPTIYFSAAFDTTDTNPIPMEEGYKRFLEQKYAYKSPNQLACFGNYSTLAEVQADMQKRAHDMRASGKWKVVDTGWTWGGTPPPPPTPVPAGMDLSVAQLQEPFRKRAIDEVPNSKQYCQDHAILSGMFDCDCFAKMVLHERIAHASEYHVPQGGQDEGGWEPLGNLFYSEKLPCTECISDTRLAKYAVAEANKSLANVIAQKGASDPSVTNTSQCTATKFILDFKAKPYIGLAQGTLSNAFSTCWKRYAQ